MPLKRIDITIDADGGRDKGKVFHIIEMGAEPFAKWLVKVAAAAKSADPSADFDITASRPVLFASVVGALLKGNPHVLIALLDEMMTCVKTGPAPGNLRMQEISRNSLPCSTCSIRSLNSTRVFRYLEANQSRFRRAGSRVARLRKYSSDHWNGCLKRQGHFA